MIRFSNTERAGLLPSFLSHDDTDGAVEQINKNYGHGGGWIDCDGWTLLIGKKKGSATMYWLEYPDEPMLPMVSMGTLLDEAIILFEHDWVTVVQTDLAFRVARIN